MSLRIPNTCLPMIKALHMAFERDAALAVVIKAELVQGRRRMHPTLKRCCSYVTRCPLHALCWTEYTAFDSIAALMTR